MKSLKALITLLAALVLVFAGGGNRDLSYNWLRHGGDGGTGASGSGNGGGSHYEATDPTVNGYSTSEDEKTYHVYTVEGLKTWADAAADAPSISCTLYACIEWDALDGDWMPIRGSSTSDRYTGAFDGGGHYIRGRGLLACTDTTTLP